MMSSGSFVNTPVQLLMQSFKGSVTCLLSLACSGAEHMTLEPGLLADLNA